MISRHMLANSWLIIDHASADCWEIICVSGMLAYSWPRMGDSWPAVGQLMSAGHELNNLNNNI